MRLELQDVALGHGERTIASALSFTIEPGEIGCLLGPSGCGKTTALRAIAGFEPVRGGEIRGDGRLLSRPGFAMAPEHRGIGLVFQDFALLPHLDCRANVGFGLFRLGRRERAARVDAMLDVVGLREQARHFPHELSGGMQQRIALARALAPRPQLLLLDEPFSSLDPELREKLALEVRRILKDQGSTALLVTHSQTEAFAMADQVGVLSKGLLRQWAAPYEIYHRPRCREVANFVGEHSWLRGQVCADGRIATALGVVQARDDGLQPGRAVDVLLRPDDIVADPLSALRARVLERSFRGADFLYTLALEDGTRLLALMTSHHDHAPGAHIGIRPDLEHVVVFTVTADSLTAAERPSAT